MTAQNDFFTWQTLATFAGTTTATTAITNGLVRVLPRRISPAPLGLAVALLLCLVTAVLDTSTGSIVFARPFATYFIAVINGFLVFASAAGLSAGGTSLAHGIKPGQGSTRGAPGQDALPPQRQVFWQHWL